MSCRKKKCQVCGALLRRGKRSRTCDVHSRVDRKVYVFLSEDYDQVFLDENGAKEFQEVSQDDEKGRIVPVSIPGEFLADFEEIYDWKVRRCHGDPIPAIRFLMALACFGQQFAEAEKKKH